MAFAELTGIALGALGGESERKAGVEGAEAQAASEQQGLDLRQEQFDLAIERNAPFLEAGQDANELLTLAIRNELESSNLPTAEIRKSLVAAGIGEDAPEFVTERAGEGIEALESEDQKSRLLDLVQIGLGAAGSASGIRSRSGASSAQSLSKIGAIKSGALQNAALQRQNTATRATDQLGGLPAFIASQRKRNVGGLPSTPTGFDVNNTGQPLLIA